MQSTTLLALIAAMSIGLAGCDGGGTTPPPSQEETPPPTPPSVTSANIAIDDTDCSGGPCSVGDAIVFQWDNSASGDGNEDVTLLTQVQFDLTEFGAGVVNPVDVTAGLFTYGWVVPAGDIDATGLSFAVTAVDAEGDGAGPVTSDDTVSLDNQPPLVSSARVSIDAAGCTGTGGSCVIGDTMVFLWDNSSAGDHNADVAQVLFDLSSVGLGQVPPSSVAAGIHRYEGTVVAGSINGDGLSIAVSVVDDAGNVTGPVASGNTVSVNNIP